jgi:DNA-binding GntR family transcriptional regulator
MRTPSDDGTGLAGVHQRLLDAIVDGRLAPGATLSQVQLAHQLGVSRTPLREALRLLERDGLIHAEANRRVVVAPLSAADLEEVYAMRITLESLAVNLSVPALSDADVVAMQHDWDEMERFAAAEDYPSWHEPHQRFHDRLTSQAGRQVRRTIDQLSFHAERYRRAYTIQVPMAWERGLEEHRNILRAVANSDPRQAASELARHYARVALSTVALISPEHDPRTVRTALQLVLTAGQPAIAAGD